MDPIIGRVKYCGVGSTPTTELETLARAYVFGVAKAASFQDEIWQLHYRPTQPARRGTARENRLRFKGQNAQKDFRHGTWPQGLVYSALNAAIASMVGHADTGRSNHLPSSKAPPGINNAGAIAIHAYAGQPVRAGRPSTKRNAAGHPAWF